MVDIELHATMVPLLAQKDKEISEKDNEIAELKLLVQALEGDSQSEPTPKRVRAKAKPDHTVEETFTDTGSPPPTDGVSDIFSISRLIQALDLGPQAKDLLSAAAKRAAKRHTAAPEDVKTAGPSSTTLLLPPGTQVVIDGLISRPELNGQHGGVISCDENRGRYCVRLNHGGKDLSLKPECLYRADHSTKKEHKGGALMEEGPVLLTMGTPSPLPEMNDHIANVSIAQMGRPRSGTPRALDEAVGAAAVQRLWDAARKVKLDNPWKTIKLRHVIDFVVLRLD